MATAADRMKSQGNEQQNLMVSLFSLLKYWQS